jgi:hypothetical protein
MKRKSLPNIKSRIVSAQNFGTSPIAMRIRRKAGEIKPSDAKKNGKVRVVRQKNRSIGGGLPQDSSVTMNRKESKEKQHPKPTPPFR